MNAKSWSSFWPCYWQPCTWLYPLTWHTDKYWRGKSSLIFECSCGFWRSNRPQTVASLLNQLRIYKTTNSLLLSSIYNLIACARKDPSLNLGSSRTVRLWKACLPWIACSHACSQGSESRLSCACKIIHTNSSPPIYDYLFLFSTVCSQRGSFLLESLGKYSKYQHNCTLGQLITWKTQFFRI